MKSRKSESSRARVRAKKLDPQLPAPLEAGPVGQRGRPAAGRRRGLEPAHLSFLLGGFGVVGPSSVPYLAAPCSPLPDTTRNPVWFLRLLPEPGCGSTTCASFCSLELADEREHLLALGPIALEYLTELTHRRPRVWIRDVERLHQLLQQHGEAALRGAFEHGLAKGLFGAEYVDHSLHSPASTPATQTELPL